MKGGTVMKKALLVTLVGSFFLISTSNVFAANHISEMATTKSGKHVAQCAKTMDKGVSECVDMTECDKTMMH